VKAIVGDKFIPGLLDRYLAWIGYSAQQTKDPVDPHRPNNLFKPVPGDHGAHGGFNRHARTKSLQLWVNMHREWLALVGLAFGAALWRKKARVKFVPTQEDARHTSLVYRRPLLQSGNQADRTTVTGL
jgi:hypothetical protein